MKKRNLILLGAALLCPAISTQAQVDEKLKEDIVKTGYIHSMLPIDNSKSYYENYAKHKKVTRQVVLNDMENLSEWTHKGVGTISLTTERCKTGKHSLRMQAKRIPDERIDWGLGLGTCMATYHVGGQNWEEFNRIKVSVYPDCPGANSIYLNMYVMNDGKIKVPDQYEREGYHEMNLVNHQWNECYIEMSALSRDKVTDIAFAIEIFGREMSMTDQMQFDVDDLQLQVVENPETVKGWNLANDRIVFSTSGYRPESEKTAIVNVAQNDGTFALKDAKTNATVYTGNITSQKTGLGNFQTIDFTEFTQSGQYYLQVGNIKTWPFYIHPNLWEDSTWRMLNFIFSERCGYPVPGKHGACHTEMHVEHDGKIIPMNGGWHDAADMSQGFLQSVEISYALFQAANNAKAKGNVNLYNRLIEEGLWGMDLGLRAHLGNGVLASGWSTNVWTDGVLGNRDDQEGGRLIKAFADGWKNFMYAGFMAYAAMTIENDVYLKQKFTRTAEEDFAWALKHFQEVGWSEVNEARNGHGKMTSQAQYHAHMSWAASLLYKLTGKKEYADEAVKAIQVTLECQRTEPLKDKDKICGFFYRDLEKKSIIHYNHQSRDYAIMEAIALLMETQPNHAEYGRWENAMKLYGQYLKTIMKYVAPYGMAPSGVYNINEEKDAKNFYVVQTRANGGLAADYAEQMKNGVKLDKEHVLRFFPVWFSFKGNTAVNLSTGKAAAIVARVLKDPELKNIAEQQLMWVVGKNPFGQSLIYGEGSNYDQLYTALPGETVGEIPVGMQSYMNEDEPYWPQFNTATYKEVWGASAARWLMLVAEF